MLVLVGSADSRTNVFAQVLIHFNVHVLVYSHHDLNMSSVIAFGVVVGEIDSAFSKPAIIIDFILARISSAALRPITAVQFLHPQSLSVGSGRAELPSLNGYKRATQTYSFGKMRELRASLSTATYPRPVGKLGIARPCLYSVPASAPPQTICHRVPMRNRISVIIRNDITPVIKQFLRLKPDVNLIHNRRVVVLSVSVGSPRKESKWIWLRLSPRHPEATRDNPRQSELARGNPRQREAIRGNSRQSEAARGNPRQREAIRGSARQSEAARGNPRQREAIRGSARQSEATRDNPRQSELARDNPRQLETFQGSGKTRANGGAKSGEIKKRTISS
ncbi:hypothetical protein V9T40_001397 [Parthenolecanium corni]|uniref:Uncharacterized protein n=1 Tax=Parthenolecanium corni TaxID=536013 RepID=A0AAN9Y2N4_9HEMI